MKTVTIDASCVISWLFPEQRTRAADKFLLEGSALWAAPDIFVWEVGNFIALRAAQGRVDPQQVQARLALLDVRVTTPRQQEAVMALIPQAVANDLSLFDTAYLLHSLGHGGGLASRNKQLLAAASKVGVDVFDLRD